MSFLNWLKNNWEIMLDYVSIFLLLLSSGMLIYQLFRGEKKFNKTIDLVTNILIFASLTFLIGTLIFFY